MKRHASGFTLIELLVVIFIISLLGAMLAPGLRKAYDATLMIDCSNKMRNIGYWFTQYHTDNRGWFPPCKSYRNKNGLSDSATWAYDYFTYTTGLDNPTDSKAPGNLELFRQLLLCKADYSEGKPNPAPYSYGYNAVLSYQNESNTKINVFKTIHKALNRVSQIYAFCERTCEKKDNSGGWGTSLNASSRAFHHFGIGTEQAHQSADVGKNNHWFLDGHVKAYYKFDCDKENKNQSVGKGYNYGCPAHGHKN